MIKKLKPREIRFCEEYIIDLNASAAAYRSGYSKSSRRKTGCMLLKRVDVKAYIDIIISERDERCRIKQDDVVNAYGRIAFFDIRKLYDDFGDVRNIQDLDDATAAALLTVKVSEGGKIESVTIADRGNALESLAKHLGMFGDVPPISNQINLNTPTTTTLNLSNLNDKRFKALETLAGEYVEIENK